MAKNILEKLFSVPSIILDKSVGGSINIVKKIISRKPFKLAEGYWNTLGPGLTTGAADDDPSGIATYSQAGAKYGFQLLWLAPFTFPLMAMVQEMCARIGLVTGEGLAGNIKRHYGKKILYFSTLLLFFANTFNLGADLGAMAKASQLVFPNVSFTILILFFTFACLALQIFTTYAKYAKYLKYLALLLLSYVLSAVVLDLDWTQIFKSAATPSVVFSRDQIFMICAILGTTISPYLFFWQTAQEVEEDILKGKITIEARRGANLVEIKRMRADVWSGMFLSNLVMFFIILACAATLHANGITNIESAEQAAMALRPLAGEFAFLLFTLGIVGAGMLAVPILAGSASYAISESFDWDRGFNLKLNQAYAFYGVIIISMFMGLLMNFMNFDSIDMLIYSAVANGIISPFILMLIVSISSDNHIMHGHANGRFTKIIGWLTVGLMLVSSGAVIFSFIV